MAFVDHVREVLRAAAPLKYPVMIDKGLYAVEAVHDDYADLRVGNVTDDAGSKPITLDAYTRSVKLSEIASVQAVPDWRIVPG